MAHISDTAGYNHGFIDITGKVVIPKNIYSAGDFSCGLAPVQWQDKWGFIDRENEC
jgi:hypothetical protein